MEHEIPDLKGRTSRPVGKTELWETRNAVLRRVTEDGEVAVITEKGKPICAIVPVEARMSVKASGLLTEIAQDKELAEWGFRLAGLSREDYKAVGEQMGPFVTKAMGRGKKVKMTAILEVVD